MNSIGARGGGTKGEAGPLVDAEAGGAVRVQEAAAKLIRFSILLSLTSAVPVSSTRNPGCVTRCTV
jgi:hypothetical protein